MQDATSRPLRLGVLGAANIARAFTSGVAPSKTVSVVAVASRDAAKAERFAHECGIPRFLGSYEAMLSDPEIDAIYNPLPNSLHAEWSIRALQAGKHLLCEKPLALNAGEARSMFATARETGRRLVEAYPYRAQAQTQKLRELLKEGAIGKVRLIRSSFGVAFSDTANIRLKPEVGGGSLLDAGSYAVSLALLAAGERPDRVSAVAKKSRRQSRRSWCWRTLLRYDPGAPVSRNHAWRNGPRRRQMRMNQGGMSARSLGGPSLLRPSQRT